jgi:hypothetical protein
MTTSTSTLQLSELGNLPAAYRHVWKVAEPQQPIVVPGAVFKWHHVHDQEISVPAELDAEARALLETAAESGEWNLSYGLNFALLHVTRTHAFLIAGVWRGHNEMWERIYWKELARPEGFQLVEPDGGATPACCVWEMGVIYHEHQAWRRFLFSDRAEADKQAWLTDTYSGRV